MDRTKLDEYEYLLSRGQRRLARNVLRSFIDSVASDPQVHDWVWQMLTRSDQQRPIALLHDYEFFEQIVYPILEQGYHTDDYEALVQLGLRHEELLRHRRLWNRLPESGIEILKRCWARNPGDERVRRALLEFSLNWLGHCFHEWPHGIIHGNDGANLDEVQLIAREIEWACALDTAGQHHEYLAELTSWLNVYLLRLEAQD